MKPSIIVTSILATGLLAGSASASLTSFTLQDTFTDRAVK